MKTENAASGFIHRIEQFTAVRAVRSSLTAMIPVLIIGAFALILKTFPVAGYQAAITETANGFIVQLLDLIYAATFGVLSLYMTYSISRTYMKLCADRDTVNVGAAFASLLSFFILAGAYLPDFGTDRMGPKSMFLAIVTGLGASALYLKLERFFRQRQRMLFSTGADREFNRMLVTLFPIALTALFFALLNAVVMLVFDVDCFHSLIILGFNRLFSIGGTGFGKGFFFVLLSSLLWFFGIHGSDTLQGVMETYFTPGLAANQAVAAAGGVPHEILTKPFFDCFVLIGGCGTTISLLIAILLFSRNRSRRGLGLTAAFPMAFNINEMMVFGLPVIFNPVMLIPFLAVPLVCYSAAYLAVSQGLVPVITGEVEWTTPIILGGYYATGSPSGAILQLINVAIGVVIYTPFVRMLDRQSEARIRRQYTSFMEFYQENEQELASQKLIDRHDLYGDFARGLCAELRHGMKRHLRLYYQPQYHYDGSCIGAEALLRWKHPVHGMMYPPLIVKLAEEGGFLEELEESVFRLAFLEHDGVLEKFGKEIKLSINVTGTTVVTPQFLQFCRKMDQNSPIRGKNLCIEVTEQAAISFNDETLHSLKALREMGFLLAIDDFSMGQTSLNYLKDNLFDIIKLDGSLVKGLFTHENCREIISSITQLASSLDLTVLAEFVETKEQREILHEIGCDCYQGYLYSPAVPLAQP